MSLTTTGTTLQDINVGSPNLSMKQLISNAQLCNYKYISTLKFLYIPHSVITIWYIPEALSNILRMSE